MKISSRQYAQALYETLAEADEGARKDLISNFLHLLKKHKKLSQTDAIVFIFEEIERKSKGVIRASLTTAYKLSDEIKKMIINFVSEESGAQQVEINETINPEVIGGISIKVKDTNYDATIKTQLELLKQQMSK